MTCLAGPLPAPVSGYSPVEVEGGSCGKASCSAARGACERDVWRSADGPFGPGPPPLQFPLCSPVADAPRDELLCQLGRATEAIAPAV